MGARNETPRKADANVELPVGQGFGAVLFPSHAATITTSIGMILLITQISERVPAGYFRTGVEVAVGRRCIGMRITLSRPIIVESSSGRTDGLFTTGDSLRGVVLLREVVDEARGVTDGTVAGIVSLGAAGIALDDASTRVVSVTVLPDCRQAETPPTIKSRTAPWTRINSPECLEVIPLWGDVLALFEAVAPSPSQPLSRQTYQHHQQRVCCRPES